MKLKISLDTLSDVRGFVEAATQADVPVYITDGNGLKVSAKSMMGALYALEFDALWCECEKDIFHLISQYSAD